MHQDAELNQICPPDIRERLQNLYRPYELTQGSGFVVHTAEREHNPELVERIIRAYHKAQVFTEDPSSFWSGHFGGIKEPIHKILMRGDISEVEAMLSDPAATDIFYGFDHPCVTWWQQLSTDTTGWQARSLHDRFMSLAEAVGAIRCYHCETPLDLQPEPKSIEDVILAVDAELGFELQLPAPFEREAGIMTSRGLLTYRPIQALYQAYLLKNNVHDFPNRSAVEIGAGLGRTAYYAVKLGCADYTIVDIPITSVAQAYFLGRTLGSDAIALYGETHNAKIRISPPDEFFGNDRRYDIALNVDSLTELSIDSINQYINFISTRTPVLLSINHEANTHRIHDLAKNISGCKVVRNLYWLRKSYVQETVSFKKPDHIENVQAVASQRRRGWLTLLQRGT